MKSIESRKDKEYKISCSYVEIDNELIYDLLDKEIGKNLKVKESKDTGVYLDGVTIMPVKSVEELEGYLKLGHSNRMIGATLLASKMPHRSHTIFTIYIEAVDLDKSIKKSNYENAVSFSKLNLFDLSGSEKTGTTMIGKPNSLDKHYLSIISLKNVIHSLSVNKSHIPFRDSKLTRLLRESFEGMTDIAMIAVLSPADINYDESLDTLKIASKAKGIENSAFEKLNSKNTMAKVLWDEDLKGLKQTMTFEQKIPIGKMAFNKTKGPEDSELNEEDSNYRDD